MHIYIYDVYTRNRVYNFQHATFSHCIGISGYLPNEIFRFTFAVSSSVHLSSVVCRLSVCLSSVSFVHPTQAIEIFSNVSTPFNMLAI